MPLQRTPNLINMIEWFCKHTINILHLLTFFTAHRALARETILVTLMNLFTFDRALPAERRYHAQVQQTNV